jgi:hypothetical protein
MPRAQVGDAGAMKAGDGKQYVVFQLHPGDAYSLPPQIDNLDENAGFQTAISVVVVAIMIRDDHTGFIIFTGSENFEP